MKTKTLNYNFNFTFHPRRRFVEFVDCLLRKLSFKSETQEIVQETLNTEEDSWKEYLRKNFDPINNTLKIDDVDSLSPTVMFLSPKESLRYQELIGLEPQNQEIPKAPQIHPVRYYCDPQGSKEDKKRLLDAIQAQYPHLSRNRIRKTMLTYIPF